MGAGDHGYRQGNTLQDYRAWVEIDQEALADNVRQVVAHLGSGPDLMAVVKANGYGHGAVTVARVALAAGATWLGVATVPEGLELRQGGITAPIMILGAVNGAAEMGAIAQAQLEPTLVSPQQAAHLATLLGASDCPPLPVHLKLDTGMTRLGCPWPQAVDFVAQVQRLPQFTIASVYSHLATADDPDPTGLKIQHQRFEAAISQLNAAGYRPPRLHLANSAATLTHPTLHYDGVRAGLVLYGYYPAPHLRSYLSLRPALAVKARITQIREIPAGTGISYNHRFVSDRPMTIAVVAIGYADGVPRALSNRLSVLLRGQFIPQVGTITMDQLMVDVSTIPAVQVGEVVTLLGTAVGAEGPQAITADAWADQLGTISWEILCGFQQRLPRILLGSP